MRMGLCGLNFFRMKNNFIQYDNCLLCGSSLEDLTHFFIGCPSLVIPRITLLARVSTLLALLPNFDLIPHHRNSKETFADNLIFRKLEPIFFDNITNLKAAIAFIEESSRFDWDSTTLEELFLYFNYSHDWYWPSLTALWRHVTQVQCMVSEVKGEHLVPVGVCKPLKINWSLDKKKSPRFRSFISRKGA